MITRLILFAELMDLITEMNVNVLVRELARSILKEDVQLIDIVNKIVLVFWIMYVVEMEGPMIMLAFQDAQVLRWLIPEDVDKIIVKSLTSYF